MPVTVAGRCMSSSQGAKGPPWFVLSHRRVCSGARQAVRRGRVLTRWSALLFESDDPAKLSSWDTENERV